MATNLETVLNTMDFLKNEYIATVKTMFTTMPSAEVAQLLVPGQTHPLILRFHIYLGDMKHVLYA